MKRIYYIIILAVLVLGSCETYPDPTVDVNPTYPVSGEWWVTYKTSNGTDVGGGYTRLLTFNTSTNRGDSIWVTDITGDKSGGAGNFWTFKCKSGLKINDRSFAGQNSASNVMMGSSPYDIRVNVANGKVIPKGGKTKGGNVSDSIYFEVQFSDDSPSFGTTYRVSGVRRTGFKEDEY